MPGVDGAWPGNPPGYTLASPSPTEPEVRSQIGSQEPIRIGPPGRLRPLNSTQANANPSTNPT